MIFNYVISFVFRGQGVRMLSSCIPKDNLPDLPLINEPVLTYLKGKPSID